MRKRAEYRQIVWELGTQKKEVAAGLHKALCSAAPLILQPEQFPLTYELRVVFRRTNEKNEISNVRSGHKSMGASRGELSICVKLYLFLRSG